MRSRRVVAGARTSLAVWPSERPDLDPAARTVTIVALGDISRDSLEAWLIEAADLVAAGAVTTIRADTLDAAALAGLRTSLAAARIGWRLLVAGPEAEVLQVLREARAAGAVASEIRTFVSDAGKGQVYCAHCSTMIQGSHGPGEVLPCPGCGQLLGVHPHLSRLHAAYLGARADGETPTDNAAHESMRAGS